MNPSPTRLVVLVATRKGAWLFHGDAAAQGLAAPTARTSSATSSATCVLDPRDGRTLLAAAKTGHLGPTVFRSTDLGRSLEGGEAAAGLRQAGRRPPARSVDHTFWLTPGHASERDTWYAGTSPQGLFRSRGRRRHLGAAAGRQRRPAVPRVDGHGAGRHARRAEAALDHRRPARPGAPATSRMSSGGVHESRDAGRSWTPLIKGLEVVEGFDAANVTFHDPHCVRLCPSQPRPALPAEPLRHLPARSARPTTWQRIGRKMPKRVGDVGFPMVVHPRDADTAWVFPMDGTTVWPRTSPRGRPAAYVTRNGGRTLAAAGRGPAREPGLVDRQAPGDDGGRAGRRRRCTWAPPAASCGSGATRARAGPTSRATCPRSTRWKWPSAVRAA